MSKANVDALRAELARRSARLKANSSSAVEYAAQSLAGAMRARVKLRSGNTANSIEAVEIAPGHWRVQAGGELTTKVVRADSGVGYEREVKIGSGDTAGIKKKAGGAGVTYDYVRAEEFGTSKEPAHPFFFNTYRAKKNGIKQDVAQKMTDGVLD